MNEWNKATLGRCAKIWNVLSQLSGCGASLPDGLTPKDEQLKTVGGLLDYAEKVAQDDVFWGSLPETLIPSEEQLQEIEQLLRKLEGRPSVTFGGPQMTTQEILDEIKQGESRVVLREELQSLLNECR